MALPVILIHGLARTARSMRKIDAALKVGGFTVYACRYPSTKYSIETLVRDYLQPLIEQVRTIHDNQPIHFVTHSMGGILLRYYARSDAAPNQSENHQKIANSVMIAPPNNGSELVDRLGGLSLYRWINGPAGLELGTSMQSLPNQIGPAKFPVGIIAGNRDISPIWARMIPRPNDGKVSVASARLQGMQDFIELPVNHTYMMNQPSVINQTRHFLKSGCFQHAAKTAQ